MKQENQKKKRKNTSTKWVNIIGESIYTIQKCIEKRENEGKTNDDSFEQFPNLI